MQRLLDCGAWSGAGSPVLGTFFAGFWNALYRNRGYGKASKYIARGSFSTKSLLALSRIEEPAVSLARIDQVWPLQHSSSFAQVITRRNHFAGLI